MKCFYGKIKVKKCLNFISVWPLGIIAWCVHEGMNADLTFKYVQLGLTIVVVINFLAFLSWVKWHWSKTFNSQSTVTAVRLTLIGFIILLVGSILEKRWPLVAVMSLFVVLYLYFLIIASRYVKRCNYVPNVASVKQYKANTSVIGEVAIDQESQKRPAKQEKKQEKQPRSERKRDDTYKSIKDIYNPYVNPRQRDITIRQASSSDSGKENDEPAVEVVINKSSDSPKSSEVYEINQSEESKEDLEQIPEVTSDDLENFIIPFVDKKQATVSV